VVRLELGEDGPPFIHQFERARGAAADLSLEASFFYARPSIMRLSRSCLIE